MRWLAPFPLSVLIFIAPFEIYGISLPGEVNIKPVFAAAFIFFLLLGPGMFLNGRVKTRIGPIGGFLAFYTVWTIFPVALAGFPWEAVRGWGSQIIFFACYLLACRSLRTEDDLRKAENVFLTIGSVVAGWGLLEFLAFALFGRVVSPPFVSVVTNLDSGFGAGGELYRGGYGYMGGLMRMHAFFSAANRLGAYLLIPFGIAYYRATRAQHLQWWMKGLALMLGATIILSLARNSYLGLVIFLGLLFLKSRYGARLKALITIVFFLAMALLYMNPNTGFTPLDHSNPFSFTERDEDEPIRNEDIFMEHLQAAVIANVSTAGIGRGIEIFDQWSYDEGLVKTWGSHSNFINFLGEGGIPGFLAQMLLVLWVIRTVLRLDSGGGSEKGHSRELHYLAIFLAVFSTGVTRTYYYTEITMLYLAMLSFVIRERTAALPRPERKPASRKRLALTS